MASSSDKTEAKDAVTVGLIADPGVPMRIASRCANKLPPLLAHRIDGSVDWLAHTSNQTLPLDDDNVLSLSREVTGTKTREGWDIAIYITDLPRIADNRVVVADINTSEHVAIISLPALGIGLTRRILNVLLHVLGKIYATDVTGHDGRGRSLKGLRTPVRATLPDRSGIDSYTALTEPQGSLRLLLGMVLSNQPWRLVGNLSSAMSAAAATGAFGIFYASIAQLSDAMSLTRLSLLTVAALGLITLWFAFRHHLWERPKGGHRRRYVIYNLSSLVTITSGILCMYIVLFVAFNVAAWLVIPVEFLEDQVGHTVGFDGYLNLGWLAASMGMIAGAIGASFDSDENVRKALYSQREANRRQESANEDDSTR